MIVIRQVDWVDRLADVRSLEPQTDTFVGLARLTPGGPWLTWPKHRRLADLVRARIQGPVMFMWFWLRWGRNRLYADAAYGIYDIHLHYRFESLRELQTEPING